MSGVYIIAEAGVNHNGERELAFNLIKAAADAGADAIKFQTFNAKKLAGEETEKANYQKMTTNKNQSQREMLLDLELSRDMHIELRKYALEQKIDFLSSPFDEDSLKFLVTLGVPILKVASGELTNGPFLWKFGHSRKKIILSTGMATLSEVERGLAILSHAFSFDIEPNNLDEVWTCWADASNREIIREKVTLMHCTSQYPTPFSEVNLRCMETMHSAFGINVGYSDHTTGSAISIAAVARGATVIEKHFTLDKKSNGPDHSSSIEPFELKKLITDIRAVSESLGDGIKAPQKSELETMNVIRRQLIAAKAITKNSIIKGSDLTTSRLGFGGEPCDYWALVGSTANKSYKKGDRIE